MNAVMVIPSCSAHGQQMELQVPRTYEQKFVGAMYKCPKCENATLFMSEEAMKWMEDKWGSGEVNR